MATQRTDVHRPSAIIPADYEFVAPEYLKIEGFGDVAYLQHCREQIRRHMERTGGTYSKHFHGGNCGVCGNVFAQYTVLFYHAKTNSYVRMGADCAEQVDMGGWQREYEKLRRAVADVRERNKGKQKAEVLLGDHGLARAWEIWSMTSRPVSTDDWAWDTLQDIVGKLVKYGSISDKQYAFLHKLVEKIDGHAAKLAQREVEKAKADAAPTGRLDVEGTIIKVEEKEDGFRGTRWVMVVKTDAGWMAWGTVPSILLGVEKIVGRRISLRAEFEPSERDAKFAFYKRPSAKFID